MSIIANRVCAVIAEETVDAARAAMMRASTVADLVELRLDYLLDFDYRDVDSLARLLEDKLLPAIITCRSIAEGGRKHIEDPMRLRLLVEGARRFADYCDIEAAHYDHAASLAPDISRLIVSYHNFEETPPDLDAVYDRVTSLPAAAHKIVTRANTITDSIAILKLLDRAYIQRRQLIAIAMGQAGVITRVIGPSRGSFLTYGSLVPGKESATGQPTCEQLIDLYRVRRLSRDTTITGIIGTPVSHSASPAMHNRAFSELDLDFVYLPLDVSNVEDFIKRLVRHDTRELDWNLRGFSVTIPHKTTIIPMLDELDKTARNAGAVNTVVVRGHRLIGYNTDVSGAMTPLEKTIELKGERCAVIGAGGAARAVISGLLDRDAVVTVFARNPEKARALLESFDINLQRIDSFAASDANVVINTSPVGMRGQNDNESPIPRSALRGRKVVYDLVYTPVETRLLADARAEGCKTITGIEMLVAQGARQFELWTGEKPPIEIMREAASLCARC